MTLLPRTLLWRTVALIAMLLFVALGDDPVSFDRVEAEV